jgi:adenine deaminase
MVVNAIGMLTGQISMRHLPMEMTARTEQLTANPQPDLAKVVVIERCRSGGRVQVGSVHGFGLKAPCPIGSTMAHDEHQLVLVGIDDEVLALAANTLTDHGGRQVVVNGAVAALLELPIDGQLSEQPVVAVAAQVEASPEPTTSSVATTTPARSPRSRGYRWPLSESFA